MRILMVCLGNICRSPLAEGILQHKINMLQLAWEVDSAGTSSWHVGEKPDPRSIATARENGIDITYQRSRQFRAQDFLDFDLILAMDSSNFQNIQRLARHEKDRQKVKMILNFLYPGENRGVPDPYYDGGFEKVFTMLDKACDNLINDWNEVGKKNGNS